MSSASSETIGKAIVLLLKIRKVERDCAAIAGAPKHLRDWLVALEFFKFAKGSSPAVVRDNRNATPLKSMRFRSD
jgi:hypothetical protein